MKSYTIKIDSQKHELLLRILSIYPLSANAPGCAPIQVFISLCLTPYYFTFQVESAAHRNNRFNRSIIYMVLPLNGLIRPMHVCLTLHESWKLCYA
jgi:hypothetical protein